MSSVARLGALALALSALACAAGSEPPDGGAPEDALAPDVEIKDAAFADAAPPDARVVRYGRMLEVPAGSFFMGCRDADAGWCPPEREGCCISTERPQHEVIIPTFYVDETEVTVEAYAACVDAGLCVLRGGAQCNHDTPDHELHPMNCAALVDAETFCVWSGKRLCSEAEWEKAARGGCEHNGGTQCQSQMRLFPWGDADPSCDFAVMNDAVLGSGCGARSTLPVGTRPAGASPYGALDMAGNEREWVQDCLHDTFEGAPRDGRAWLEGCAQPGMGKGGSLLSAARFLRSSTRFLSGGSESCCGFRCCADAPP